MDQLNILAKNESGDDPFRVDFVLDEGKLRITCDCPDGRKGLVCSHKIRLASNDLMMLEHPSSRGRLLEAHVWVIQSEMSDYLLDLLQRQGEGTTNTTEYSELMEKVGRMMKEGSRLQK